MMEEPKSPVYRSLSSGFFEHVMCSSVYLSGAEGKYLDNHLGGRNFP